jgi:hypothetical protein
MKIKIENKGLSAMMVGMLNAKIPALPAFFEKVAVAAKGAELVKDQKGNVAEALEKAGADGESLFTELKRLAVALATADNGEGNPRGVDGITLRDYFIGRVAAEGLPDNTGRSYANLGAQMVEALRQGFTTPDELVEWTRQDATQFFAEEDAAARQALKALFGESIKGATAEYCRQVKEHLATFQYARPEGDYGESDIRWTGIKRPKPKKGDKDKVTPSPEVITKTLEARDAEDADADRELGNE